MKRQILIANKNSGRAISIDVAEDDVVTLVRNAPQPNVAVQNTFDGLYFNGFSGFFYIDTDQAKPHAKRCCEEWGNALANLAKGLEPIHKVGN